MKIKDVNKYLERLIKLSERKLNEHFKISELEFDQFGIVNSYLISQAIKFNENEKNTLIFIPDKETKSQFYIPAIYTLALYNFIDNSGYPTVYKIGDILQERGNRYEIIKKTKEGYALQGSNLQKFPTHKQMKKYIITNANLTVRKVKIRFDNYKRFFKRIIVEEVLELSEGKKEFPSKFIYKSIIVTDRSIVSKLKEYKINGEEIHKAFPFQYITSSGKRTDNIPIDPMIYIVTDYKTARKYILDKGILVNNVTFIGKNKYEDYHLKISEDLNNNRIKNCLLIGSADIPENAIPSLLKWKWTLPELDYFNYFKSHPINKIIVLNEKFSEHLKEFDCLVKRIEEEYGINLQELYKFVRNILPIVIPSPKSRLISQLDNTLIYFEREGEDIVETAFSEIDEYDYKDIWDEILEKFTKLINCKKSSQLKFEKIKEFQKIDYLIIPKEYLEIWGEEINRHKIKNVISFKEFNNLDTKNKTIVFLGLFGYNHLKSMMYNSNKISIILYPQEEEHFNDCFNRLKRETYKELKNSDRKTISQVPFKETEQIETTSELIKRLFERDEKTKINPDYSESYATNIRKLTFKNDTEDLELDENKTVLLKMNQKERPEKVKNLKVGDKIRVYDNSSKEELYKVALESDADGEFIKIEEFSKLWKKELQDFYKKNFNSLDELYKHLVKNRLTIRNENTLKNWMNLESDVMFPQKNKDMSVLKKTINSDLLNENFSAILKSKQSFIGIMIALGRYFSDEISDYIRYTKKGKLLKQFSEEQIQQFVNKNAKERTIKTIKTIEYEQ